VLIGKGFRKRSMVKRLPIINMKRGETLTYQYILYENVKQLVTYLISSQKLNWDPYCGLDYLTRESQLRL